MLTSVNATIYTAELRLINRNTHKQIYNTMLILNTTFHNGTEVDLTNGEHARPHLTLCTDDTCSRYSWYVIKNYMTGDEKARFSDLDIAIKYCNDNFNTNFNTL